MHFLKRDEFGSNLNHMQLTGVGVEVGVHRGDYAEIIAKSWGGKELHLVDHWKKTDYVDLCSGLTQADQERCLHQVRSKFKADQKIKIHQINSIEGAKEFADNSLDFVYLDADHSFAGASADIDAWWPKIKDGGILSGHDYVNAYWGDPQKDPKATWTMAKAAVDNKFKDHMILSTWQDKTPSWNVIKFDRPSPNDVMVVSYATPNLEYSIETEKNHLEYCDKWGFKYEMIREPFLPNHIHPAWNKIPAVQKHLGDYRWVMWLDADAVFVDHSIDLRRFLAPIFGHISSSWNAFGSMRLTNGISFWQNTQWTHEKLKESLKYSEPFAQHGVWEEEGIQRAIVDDSNSYGKWLGVELHHFNSWPHYNAWKVKDFIHHFGGVKYKKEKLIYDSIAFSKTVNQRNS